MFDKHLPRITLSIIVGYETLGRCWHFFAKFLDKSRDVRNIYDIVV